jgi:imidazolonepropionase-like amidohydrolase/Tol biopolymer transport system component
MLKKILLLLILVTSLSFAQKKDKSIDKSEENKKWDVNNPPGKYKENEFTTETTTWTNLDVSPDGKEIVFDVLGDIYIAPIEGGEPKLLREGLAWEVQPRFSPNGKYISFTSDIGGGDNIWYMEKDGKNPKQITKEEFRLLNNAVWTPDGNFIIARKHFTATRSAGAGEMWMYHITGGSGIGLTKRKNDQQDVNEPSVSPDGRYLYYCEDVYPGGSFQYNKDPNSQIYVIKKYDKETGKTENVISGGGGAFRPQISRDGKKLAFIRRVRTKTVLMIHDLASGEQKVIYDKLTKDQQEAWAIFGVYSNFNWTPDDKNIIIWSEGKIQNIDVATGNATPINMKIKVKKRIFDALTIEQEVSPKEFNSKAIRQAVTSPDGTKLVFNAVGYLWYKELPNGKPQRLTTNTDFEFEPSFSSDGNSVIYVTWNDENMGQIQRYNFTSKRVMLVMGEKAIYRMPSFSPDGTKIVYYKEAGNSNQGYTHTKQPGIYFADLGNYEAKFVTNEGEYPTFNAKGDRIFYQTGGYLFGALEKGFHSVNLSGNDKRTHFTSKYTNRFVPSPDNKWIAFNELHKAYVAVFPESGNSIDLSASTTAVPVAPLTKDAGINLHWTKNSKTICWTLGEQYFANDLTSRFKFLEGSKSELPPLDTVGIPINLVLKTDVPEGIIALTNARIITMDKSSKVIENGTIIVENNRIKEIGTNLTIPTNSKVIDCNGKTIMPGIIDVHAHLGTFRYGLSPQKHWQYHANLAYGVTTTHDPSSNTEMVFSQSEMIKTGNMVGPRVYSTGVILYGADGDFKATVNSLDDALSHLRRTKAFGAFSVKSYNQPRREQRQQVIEAARQLGMIVVPEGGSHFFHNMSMIADGHTGIEHNIPVAPLYDDVLGFWGKSKTANTPTLIVSYGGVSGEYYWYQKTNVWEKERLLNFTPRDIIDSRSRHRTMIPDEEYENGHILISKSLKKLTDAGVKVNLGAHGQIQGIGAHWELWMLKQGGMTEMEALRSATMNGAEYIGMGKELGSLEKGKLADLVIMEKNPLENIQNSESITHTMINGRLFEANSMNEIGNYDKKRTKFFWETFGTNSYFDGSDLENINSTPKCSCGH